MATAAPAQNSSNASTLSEWAGPYVTNMLGKTAAIADQPYQVYQGPMTAGESNLQSKVFQGLGGLSFPSNLGKSFSSSSAPAMPTNPFASNMQPPAMLNQGSNGFGDFGGQPNNMMLPALQNQGPAQPGGTYEDYANSPTQELKMSRDQWQANQDQLDWQRQTGMDMLGRGNMEEIIAGLGGKPGQMPQQGGLAGLIGGMPQQPQQQTEGIAQQYMNPYLESVLAPQLAEMRRQAQINNQTSMGNLTKAGAFGGGRQAIMQAEGNRNLSQEQNKAIGQGYSNAFDKAQQQFNIEQGQAKTLADLMSTVGQTQRGIEQEGITSDYNEFLSQRDYPQKMLQFQQSMLQGLPISTVTNQAAPLSGIAQLSSTVGGLGNIVDSLKKFNLT